MKGKIKRRVAALAVAATVLLAFTACNDSAAKEEYFEVFGTTLCITTANAEEAERAALEMQDTELAVSAAIADSDIGRINAAAAGESVVVGDITMQLLRKAYRAYELTDGAYDPTVAPLVELWGFAAGDFVQGAAPEKLPSAEEVAAERGKVGFDRAFRLDPENNSVEKLIEGVMLDLGGIAKGDAVARSLGGFTGECLVNLGGNIGGVGKDHRIGIGAPRPSEKAYIGIVTLHSGECISTSGDYERYYEKDGKRYHHIIDPFTGRPADSGLISVTVICSDGALGDALSTAIMVAGEEKGREWLDALSAEYPEIAAVFVHEDLTTATWGRDMQAA